MNKRTFKCATCGEETDICYTDNGILGMTHGFCQCKDCYVKSGHPLCPSCGELTDEEWNFCTHCGKALKK